jgi:hypothetical protein
VGLAAKLDQTNPSVQAALNYIIDTGEKPVTASNAPGGPRVTTHTGKYEERTVTIHNGRLSRDDLSLEREGFVLVDRETKVKNFYDEGEDSATDGRARWTAHAAFDDPTSEPDAPDRESIEVRTLAFFSPEPK